ASARTAEACRSGHGSRPQSIVRRRRSVARSRSRAPCRRRRVAGSHRVWQDRGSGSAAASGALSRGQQRHGSRFLDPARIVMRTATASRLDPGRLLQLIDGFLRLRVAGFGDVIGDEFIYGDIARVSREAPVLILNYDSTEIVPGGAGNAATNVAALGGSAIPGGFAGRDETGSRLLDALRPHVDVRAIVRPLGFRTPTKTRILAGGVHSAKQQVVRIDRSASPQGTDADHRAIATNLMNAAGRCDALLVSDYGIG